MITLSDKPEREHSAYKERRKFECAFKSSKISGFNIENTHLGATGRLEKLFSLVMVAFAWAYLADIHNHDNLKPIRMLKHGFKAKTFFKYSLDTIALALLNPENHKDNLCFKCLSGSYVLDIARRRSLFLQPDMHYRLAHRIIETIRGRM